MTGGGSHVAERTDAAVESFEEFYRREFPHLLVLARAMVGPGLDEDVVQETFVAAYQSWRRIAVMASPVGYVRGICLHKAASAARRRSLERRILRRVRPAPASVDGLPDDSALFWEHVRTLPTRQAQAVALFYALDLPVAEIAQVLDCAEGTVKVHLHRARQVLTTRMGLSEESP